jgi:amino acid transporter
MEEGTYRQSLGQVELVSLGIGGTIGSGIFVVPGIAAGIMGPASLIAWIIVAISATLVMISLSWASAQFGRKGTFFAIFNSVFGRKTSTALILLYIVSAIFGVATIAAGIGQYISFFGIGNLLIIEILIIAAFCIVNLIGISVSSLTENILTLLKILPLVVITLILLLFIKPENLDPTVPFTFFGLFSTIIIVYWPFTGFEISALPVEEMRDPRTGSHCHSDRTPTTDFRLRGCDHRDLCHAFGHERLHYCLFPGRA